MKTKHLFFLILILTVTFSTVTLNSCINKEDLSEYEIGYLTDMTRLDACGWMIILEDGQRLEPINLDDFDVPLKENQKVLIQYQIPKDIGSFCMAGTVVQITNLKLP